MSGHPTPRRPVRGDQRLPARPATSRPRSTSWTGGSGAATGTWCCWARPAPARAPRPPGWSSGCSGRPWCWRRTRRLAAQLAKEFRELMPHNAVEYFVSLLRLLPARGLHPADRHLHREGLLDQRGGRAAAALGDDVAADPARRDRGGHRLGDLRPGHAAGVPRPVGEAGASAARSSATSCCGAWSTSSTRATTWPSTAAPSGSAATRWRSFRRTRSWRSGSSSSATRSRSSTTCTRSPATWSGGRPAAHLPGHALRGRPGADGAGDPRHRGRAGGAAGRAGAAEQAAGGAAAADAHHLRHRDDAAGRVLLRHRELLAATSTAASPAARHTACSTTSPTTSSRSSTSRT